MTEPLPATAVVRASRATFDPSRFAEVNAANTKTSEYLIPAVKQLPGLIHFYAGVSLVGVTFTPIATYPVSWTI